MMMMKMMIRHNFISNRDEFQIESPSSQINNLYSPNKWQTSVYKKSNKKIESPKVINRHLN